MLHILDWYRHPLCTFMSTSACVVKAFVSPCVILMHLAPIIGPKQALLRVAVMGYMVNAVIG